MPAFHDGKIIFWTAARAHHADIGGIRPGSMPPFSKELWEEGAQFTSFKLVNEGKFDEEGVKRILVEEAGQYPGCSGTRTLDDVSICFSIRTSLNKCLAYVDLRLSAVPS